MTGNDRPALGVTPLYAHDNLYVGIDIGKKEHVAAFVRARRFLAEAAAQGAAIVCFPGEPICPAIAGATSRRHHRTSARRSAHCMDPRRTCVATIEASSSQRG